jgi:hypothetical protein
MRPTRLLLNFASWKRRALLGGAVLLWLAAALWLTRGYQLDDAFITLRYAGNLAKLHFLTFDGLHRTYGASSLLYVFLVAHALTLVAPPDTTKLLSVAAYGLLCIVILAQAFLNRPRNSAMSWWLLLFVVASPMGVRWLSDGMETSLAMLIGIGLAFVASTESRRPPSALRYPALAGFGAVAYLLRPGFAVPIAAASAAMVVIDLSHRELTACGWLRALPGAAIRRSHLAVGATVAILAVYHAFGQLLPDTAIAKAAGFAISLGRLRSFEPVFGGSLSFGTGLLVLWALSAIEVMRGRTFSGRLAASTINLAFPTLAVAGWLRGQNMQIRYFAPILIFACAWNLKESKHFLVTVPSRMTRYWLAITALVAVEICIEGALAYHICASSAVALDKMRDEHLARLAGLRGVAGDIGAISYFSKGHMCDLDGLVQGRSWALLSPEDRLQKCAAESLQFAYLDDTQVAAFERVFPLDKMRECYRYPLGNMSHTDTHYLFLVPSLAARFCGKNSTQVAALRDDRSPRRVSATENRGVSFAK